MNMTPAERCRAARDGSLSVWDPEVDDVLVCVDARLETHDVRTFTFVSRTPSRFSYWPGQFLVFDVPVGGEIVQRCYTIASSPTRPDQISITVKRKPGGAVSPWLHDNLRPGMEIRAIGPLGDFSFVATPGEKYLLLSGGSGITPLMSMTRAHQDLAPDADIVFIHFARTPEDIIFRDELAVMARQMPNLRVIPVCEADGAGGRWGGPRGRVTPQLLSLLAPDFAERWIFNCGPPVYMQVVRDGLVGLGYDMRYYYEESFDFGVPPPVEEVLAAQGAETFEVTFSKSGRTIGVAPGQHILAAAREAGMRLPSSCTKGVCGTCKSKLVSGRVDMKHQGGIRQREIDQDMILICCSTPLTDLVIER
ncbi:hybrid-cluster NAD(P)-dependent oxidoreductase [Acidiphilium sp.]|uniref:hybrid-cluster NAD(P)-dependent oxidoreductase n=1 Tax=Acidiphilium sp. TaxID=527 RepID=UPI0025832354|nr:hybrid-cluster NAD(P)-dependent oxidoreductase [Acidiphilium sp.]